MNQPAPVQLSEADIQRLAGAIVQQQGTSTNAYGSDAEAAKVVFGFLQAAQANRARLRKGVLVRRNAHGEKSRTLPLANQAAVIVEVFDSYRVSPDGVAYNAILAIAHNKEQGVLLHTADLAFFEPVSGGTPAKKASAAAPKKPAPKRKK